MKSTPPLEELTDLDRGKGVIVDEMHGAFLGIAKQVVTKWIKEMSKEQVLHKLLFHPEKKVIASSQSSPLVENCPVAPSGGNEVSSRM